MDCSFHQVFSPALGAPLRLHIHLQKHKDENKAFVQQEVEKPELFGGGDFLFLVKILRVCYARLLNWSLGWKMEI